MRTGEENKPKEQPVPIPDRPLAVAQQLQRGLLPEMIPQAHPLHIGALSLPADKVGGDFFDFIPRASGSFDFVLGDVTGHGLTAALVVALAQATFREVVETDVEVPQLLDHSDRLLYERLRRRLFIAANYGHVVPGNRQVHLFNAAQQALFFDAQTGGCREIEVEGSTYPLGIVGRGGYVPHPLTLNQGDMVVCFSDGLPEALNPQEEMFEHERLKATIQEASAAEPEELVNHVFQEVFDFTQGREKSDDLTLLVVKADVERRVQGAPTTERTLVGERRPVALFCLQSLEGEEPSTVPEATWQPIQEEVDQHGGVIDQLSPDTLIACFGLPELHEDDPERAILAARGTEQILRQGGLSSRGGLHLGTIIAHADGSLDYSLMGETLVETLRLLDEAPPGMSHLSEAAFQRLEGRMRLPASREIQHGRPVYALSSLAPVRGLRRYGKQVGGIYVGRRAELRRLHQAWRRAKQRPGVPTVVSIVGEAGIGKSRLVEEFLERRKPERVLQGQARAYPPEAGGLFASLVRHWLEVEKEEGERAVDRLDEKLEQWDDARVKEGVPFLKALLGFREELPPYLDPQGYQVGLVQAIQGLVEGLAAPTPDGGEPLVLVLEDLQWMDSVSALMLTALVQEFQAGAGVLILGISRPEEEVGSIFSRCRRHTRMALGSLPEEDVSQWLQGVLGEAQLPAETVQAFLRQGEGHPLFLEELVRHLREQELLYPEEGAWKLAGPAMEQVPESLNGLILSRVVQVMDPVRRTLREASVIGQEFAVDLLARVTGDPEALPGYLDALVEGQFIVAAGERDFIFRHALIRQAVYEALLPDDRTRLHGRVGQVLEEHYPEDVERQPEMLAHHYTEGGFREQAIPYWQQAGQRATQSAAHQEAIDYLTRGLELVETLPDTPERVPQELTLRVALSVPLASTTGYGDPEIGRNLARARTLGRQVGETPLLFPVLWGLYVFYMMRGDMPAIQELGEQLLGMAQQARDPSLSLEAYHALGMASFHRAQFESAQEYLEQALSLYDFPQHSSHCYLYGFDPALSCTVYASFAQCYFGYLDQALKKVQECHVLAQKLAHPSSLAYGRMGHALVHLHRREAPETQTEAETCIALSKEHGLGHWLAWGNVLRGWARAMQGETEEGIRQIRQGLDFHHTIGSKISLPTELGLLAEACLLGGQIQEGIAAVEEALSEVSTRGEAWWSAELHRLKGTLQLALSVGHPADAEGCFQQSIIIARQQGVKYFELRATTSLARLLQKQGRIAEARKRLGEIYSGFSEGWDTTPLHEARLLLDELSRRG